MCEEGDENTKPVAVIKSIVPSDNVNTLVQDEDEKSKETEEEASLEDLMSQLKNMK